MPEAAMSAGLRKMLIWDRGCGGSGSADRAETDASAAAERSIRCGEPSEFDDLDRSCAEYENLQPAPKLLRLCARLPTPHHPGRLHFYHPNGPSAKMPCGNALLTTAYATKCRRRACDVEPTE